MCSTVRSCSYLRTWGFRSSRYTLQRSVPSTSAVLATLSPVDRMWSTISACRAVTGRSCTGTGALLNACAPRGLNEGLIAHRTGLGVNPLRWSPRQHWTLPVDKSLLCVASAQPQDVVAPRLYADPRGAAQHSLAQSEGITSPARAQPRPRFALLRSFPGIRCGAPPSR